MDVFLADEQSLEVDEARLIALADHALAAENTDDSAELSILLVTASHMQQLNRRFAGNDDATDVLAFPMTDEDEETLILGDVVVCPEVARRAVVDLNHSLQREIEILLVHGILHLLGLDHQNIEERARMERRLSEILGSFNPAPAS